MIFSTIMFIFFFLTIVIFLYLICPSFARNSILLLASLFFYAWGEPVYIVLMLFSIVFNYCVALDIERSRNNALRCKWNLVFGVGIDLFLLFYFKYWNFAGSVFHFPAKEIALPIGISFYTFQTLSYIVDVYKKEVPPQKNFIDFALYVSMFPQLIAGPIVRYADIKEQIHHRENNPYMFGEGAELFLFGLAKKVLLANQVGSLAGAIQNMQAGSRPAVTVWIGAIAYTLQIYFDFSAYSDMAIGLGKIFGFTFKKNFDDPYLSQSVTEFWRRWHISLGNWFREYVYIPLGGNRKGAFKHIRNIMIVWFLTGLWHGASWNFVCWGLYYGILLILEKKIFGKFLASWPAIVKHIYTMFFVILGWVLFMSENITQAVWYVLDMCGCSGVFVDATTLYYLKSYFWIFIICIIFCGESGRLVYMKLRKKSPVSAVVLQLFLWILIVSHLLYDSYNPFLYFRF